MVQIAGRECYLFGESTAEAEILLLQPLGEHEVQGIEREYQSIQAGTQKRFLLIAFLVGDWNRELSPWRAPGVRQGEEFAGEGTETLRFLEEQLIPEAIRTYGLREDVPVVLGGYSLAGLFALWAAYRTDRFRAVAAVSPSVWFPGFLEYVLREEVRTEAVYLSLGEKEERTRNRQMACVGENIRQIGAMYEKSLAGENAKLEWNPGNHFQEPERRTAKGFLWALEREFLLQFKKPVLR